MSLDRKVIEYKIRIVGELICEDELVKNMTMEICYEVINTITNNIYIPINICLEGYNRYELCVCINSGCFVCFKKDHYFNNLFGKKAKISLHVRIADNSIMSHKEAIEGLCIEIGGVQCIISIL